VDLSQLVNLTPAQLLTLAVLVSVFGIASYLRGRIASAKQAGELAKLRVEFEGKLKLSQEDAARQRQADVAQLEREKNARFLRELEIQNEQDKRNGERLDRFADSNNKIADATAATNRIMTSMYEMQTEASARHEANAGRLIKLQTSSDDNYRQVVAKIDAVSAEETNTKAQVVETNKRIDTVVDEIKRIATNVDMAGSITKELRAKLIDTDFLKTIDTLGAFMSETKGLLQTMDANVKAIKKGDTGPLDPAKLGVEPIVAPTVSRAVGLDNAPRTRTGNTDKLPAIPNAVKKQTDQLTDPPPPTIIPVAPVDLSRPVGTFATSNTPSNVETQKLDTAAIRAANDAQHVPTTKPEGRHDVQ
jgi:hypothetical protein